MGDAIRYGGGSLWISGPCPYSKSSLQAKRRIWFSCLNVSENGCLAARNNIRTELRRASPKPACVASGIFKLNLDHGRAGALPPPGPRSQPPQIVRDGPGPGTKRSRAMAGRGAEPASRVWSASITWRSRWATSTRRSPSGAGCSRSHSAAGAPPWPSSTWAISSSRSRAAATRSRTVTGTSASWSTAGRRLPPRP